MAGVRAAFGIAWGAHRGSWRAVLGDAEGRAEFLPGAAVGGAVPAAAFAVAAVRPEHAFDVCLVALASDAGDRFLTVVVADGAPVVFSEDVHEDAGKWRLAAEAAVENASIHRVYLPEDFGAAASGKIVHFAPGDLALPPGVKPLRRQGVRRMLLAGLAAVHVAAAALYWQFAAGTGPDPATERAADAIRTEVSRVATAPILAHCADALAGFWPMAPEWDLVEEGCVVDPAAAPRALPDIRGESAYAYRLYRLDDGWNEYLALRAAESITRRFHGLTARAPSRIALYVDTPRTRELVAAAFTPETDVGPILERVFVGNVEVRSGPADRGVVEATTSLELRAVMKRMQGVGVDVLSLARRLDSRETRIRVRPVRLLTERIRLDVETPPALDVYRDTDPAPVSVAR